MAIVSLPPESRKSLNSDEGTVEFVYNLTQPLRAAPADVSVMILDEISVNGTVFRVVAGPGFAWRFIRERGGEACEAGANLAPLGGAQSLHFFLRWLSNGEVALDVAARDRPQGVWAKGRSAGYVEPVD